VSLSKNYVNNFEVDAYVDSLSILKIIKNNFRVRYVYSSKLDKLKEFCKKKKIFIKKIDTKIKKVKQNTISIICGVSKIFTIYEINKYSKRVINIHFGDLPKYRGRHPLTWAILNDEKKIGCTIHLINEKIDQGFVLKKFFVQNNLNDNSQTIEKKIIELLGFNLVLAVNNLNKNRYKKIKKGRYFPPLYNGIKIINTKLYNRQYLICALKAQFSHGGVQLNQKKYKYYSLSPKKGYKEFICLHKKKIFLR